MANITLNLNKKSALFKVAGFIAKVEINEQVEAKLAAINFDAEDGFKAFISIAQSLAGTLESIEDDLDQLLADLAGVPVSAITDLDPLAYIELVTSFLKADFLKQAFALVKSLKG